MKLASKSQYCSTKIFLPIISLSKGNTINLPISKVAVMYEEQRIPFDQELHFIKDAPRFPLLWSIFMTHDAELSIRTS